jgi:hypothetical protein
MAMDMDWVDTLAHCVAFGKMDGGEFNWSTLEFEKRTP